MNPLIIMDACSMLAVLLKEPGAEKVADIYKKAATGQLRLIMHKLNFLPAA